MPVLTGTYVHGDGTGRTGSLRFAPSVAIAGNDVVILPAPFAVELAAAGSFTVTEMVGTDDVAYAPSGWVWTVTEVMDGGRTFAFELTADSDISDLVPVVVPDNYAAFVMVGDELTASLTSGAATVGLVPTADGAGGIDWAATAGGVASVNTQTGAVVLDAADVGAVPNDLFDANSILAATADNTPAALTVPASSLVGRGAAGGIAALSVADAKTLLAVTATDVGAVPASLVDAKGDLLVGTADNTVARLPVGATTGHVLTVDPAEATGLKFAAAGGGYLLSAAGFWLQTTQTQLPGVYAHPNETRHWCPVSLAKAISVDALGVRVTTLEAASTVRLGLYSATATGMPGPLIVDAGTVSGAGTGEAAASITQTLQPGIYWMVAQVASAGVLALASNIQMRGIVGGAMFPAAYIADAVSSTYQQNGWADTGTGALPSTAPASFAGSGRRQIVVGMRMA